MDELRKGGSGPSMEEDIDADEHLPPLEVGPQEHRLQYTYGLWYIGKTNYQQYDLTLKKIGRFASVEQFWALYSHLVRPSDLHSPSDFFLFRDGIKPMWEHKGNREGGQWLVRLNKGLAARCWENLVMAILGEQFNVGDEICGAGVSMRQKKDCISLWNKTSADQETTEKIRDVMRKVLNLPSHFQLEYRCHKDVLQWLNNRDVGPGGPSVGPSKPRSTSPTMESLPLRGFSGGTGGGAPGLHLPNSSNAHR
jgi:translation initiation factor 4E